MERERDIYFETFSELSGNKKFNGINKGEVDHVRAKKSIRSEKDPSR